MKGGLVSVKVDPSLPSLLLVDGESYRVGQIGAFLRVPLGYVDLLAVATQIGASPSGAAESVVDGQPLEALEQSTPGYRWMTMFLFGEMKSGQFERGVSQYPTVGDEVHLVTAPQMDAIYDRNLGPDVLTIGRIANSNGVPARLQLSTLLSRHSTIVGSTGAGKSNLVAVALEEIARGPFPAARVLVIDPHGEYGSVVPDASRVVSTGNGRVADGVRLHVPYWALPLDQLIKLTMGEMQPSVTEHIRDRIRQMKVEAAAFLPNPPPAESISADSPLPFSIRRLWLELENEERVTYSESSNQTPATRNEAIDQGDEASLRPPVYPAPTSTNTPPYPNRARRQISRQLDLLRSRIRDEQFAFMFDPTHPTSPDHEGRVNADLDTLLAAWIGGPEPVTIVDVSGIPAEALGVVVGTLSRIVYDALFWAMNLPIGGRKQPLLIVLDEAHLFLPRGSETPAHRIFSRIAKEGRKYGVGLMIVSQRPSDVDTGVLSQCGTMLALRVTNDQDRSAVSAAVPDDLGGLTSMLPSLRTGEALVLGDALQVPSRARVRLARNKPLGGDPDLPGGWLTQRPDPALYSEAVRNWRLRTTEGA